MSTQLDTGRLKTDHLLVASILFLVGLGLVTLYSSSYAFAQRFFSNGLYLTLRQAGLGAVGIILFFITFTGIFLNLRYCQFIT